MVRVKPEADLYRHTVDPSDYKAYLIQKRETDKLTCSFYQQDKNFCNRKRSEDKLVNRMRRLYGKTVRPALQGLLWKPVFKEAAEGLQARTHSGLFSKWFEVVDVDEFTTSKDLQHLLWPLTKYRNRRGSVSYSRLKCTSYLSRGKPKIR